jgi:hypothetical protein
MAPRKNTVSRAAPAVAPSTRTTTDTPAASNNAQLWHRIITVIAVGVALLGGLLAAFAFASEGGGTMETSVFTIAIGSWYALIFHGFATGILWLIFRTYGPYSLLAVILSFIGAELVFMAASGEQTLMGWFILTVFSPQIPAIIMEYVPRMGIAVNVIAIAAGITWLTLEYQRSAPEVSLKKRVRLAAIGAIMLYVLFGVFSCAKLAE